MGIPRHIDNIKNKDL